MTTRTLSIILAFLALLACACEPYDRSRVGGGVRQRWQSNPLMLLRIDSALIRDDSFHVHVAVVNRDTADRRIPRLQPHRGIRDHVFGLWITGCGGVSAIDWLNANSEINVTKLPPLELNDDTSYLIPPSSSVVWTMSYPIAEITVNDPTCFDSVQVALVLSNRIYSNTTPDVFKGKLLSEWAKVAAD